MVVANHVLHGLAGIDENAREFLEYIKEGDVIEFEIAMGTGGKTCKDFYTRRNGIARSLWMVKTNTCITETFTMDGD
jgi:hypothetical protein